MEKKRVNCLKCKHYYVTYENAFPRGCKQYGIKTSQMPSVVVQTTTPQGCIAFEEKASKDKGLDLNRDDLW
ncbi:MAG: uracil-DNA glycosylase [Bacteriovoracaceae bacterium]|nr:uracil-DNA glycosylase [Bacteriovoracaceae bacterium]